jgi:hypothetical protein
LKTSLSSSAPEIKAATSSSSSSISTETKAIDNPGVASSSSSSSSTTTVVPYILNVESKAKLDHERLAAARQTVSSLRIVLGGKIHPFTVIY